MERLLRAALRVPAHEPSASADARASAFAEGGDEGPRRVVFDLENISEHEKAAGAKSEGLTIGPCCDYHGSKPVLLCDLEIVLLHLAVIVLLRGGWAAPEIQNEVSLRAFGQDAAS